VGVIVPLSLHVDVAADAPQNPCRVIVSAYARAFGPASMIAGLSSSPARVRFLPTPCAGYARIPTASPEWGIAYAPCWMLILPGGMLSNVGEPCRGNRAGIAEQQITAACGVILILGVNRLSFIDTVTRRISGRVGQSGRVLSRREVFIWAAAVLFLNQLFGVIKEMSAASLESLVTDLIAIGIFQYLAWYVIFRLIGSSDLPPAARLRDFRSPRHFAF
jgi:hypothetical protein